MSGETRGGKGPPRPGDPEGGEKAGAASTRRKRPWKAPRVDSGKLFESNSLACGKATPYFEQCVQNPTRS